MKLKATLPERRCTEWLGDRRVCGKPAAYVVRDEHGEHFACDEHHLNAAYAVPIDEWFDGHGMPREVVEVDTDELEESVIELSDMVEGF